MNQEYERLDSKEEGNTKNSSSIKMQNLKDFFSIFKPQQGYYITPLLIDLNILIFILMAITGVDIFSPDNQSLLNWGANFRPMTLEGQWWRLLTNCFLHIGIFHLLMNMYALLYIGVLLEPLIGKTRFFGAYLLTGITASVASLWWHDLTISAGASGAIFGMYGVFLAMLTTNLIEKETRKPLLTSIGIFVGYNLIYGLDGSIDNAAHIGGLVGGLLIGYALIPGLKRPDNKNFTFGTLGFLAMLVIAFSFIVYQKLPNDVSIYDKKMDEFAAMESKALEVYNLPPDTPTDQLLSQIKDTGIYYWNENIKLINGFDKLELPAEIRTRNKILKNYCELRIKSYELIYKAIDEDSEQYKTQIEDYDKQIMEAIKKLNAEE